MIYKLTTQNPVISQKKSLKNEKKNKTKQNKKKKKMEERKKRKTLFK